MTEVLKYEADHGNVADILVSVLEKDGNRLILSEPDETLEGLAVVVCETMPIAMIQHVEGNEFKVTHLACYQPIHGAHPKMVELSKSLLGFTRANRSSPVCQMCGGKEWLPVGGEEARTGAAFAISLGIFRGVQLPKCEELEQLRETAMEKAFANILNNPSLKNIQTQLSGQSGDDTGTGE